MVTIYNISTRHAHTRQKYMWSVPIRHKLIHGPVAYHLIQHGCSVCPWMFGGLPLINNNGNRSAICLQISAVYTYKLTSTVNKYLAKPELQLRGSFCEVEINVLSSLFCYCNLIDICSHYGIYLLTWIIVCVCVGGVGCVCKRHSNSTWSH